MRNDLYPAPESANGGGLLTIALLIGFVLLLASFNWLVHEVAWRYGVGL